MRFGRFLLHFFKPLFCLIFPYRVIGRENIPTASPDNPLVVCCNHISAIDPVYLLEICKQHIYYMGKEELFHSAFSRWFLGKVMGVFAVRRGKGDTNAIQVAKDIVASGRIMGIFPEGTRSKDGKLLRAKSGASLIVSQTGANVLPVAVVSKNQKVRPFRKATIVFGKPMTPAEMHLDNKEKPELRYASKMLMAQIGALMEQAPNYVQPNAEESA